MSGHALALLDVIPRNCRSRSSPEEPRTHDYPRNTPRNLRLFCEFSPVVVHPSVAFGMPNVDGISTERWYELVVAGESLSEVVSGCDISVELLRNTCAYEEMARRLAA